MKAIRNLIKVSRPRFWLYIFGPYIVGLAAGADSRSDFIDWQIILFGFYFLFPANLLIYGVNDIADYETDKLNPKKQGYETLVAPDSRRSLSIWIAVFNIPFLVAAAVFYPSGLLILSGFVFLSLFYSLPPIRAKAVPFLDSAFNILYVFPGIFSYYMMSGSYPQFSALLAAGLWTAAMHAYSAVPDIEADREARVPTIATTLGPRVTLMLCGLLYAASSILAFQYLSYLSVILGAAYLIMIALSFRTADRASVFSIYRYFPILNAVGGFLIFWYAFLSHIPLK